MKTVVSALVLLLLSCVCNKDTLTVARECGRECFTGGDVINAPCRRGVIKCNDDGTSVCYDQVVPAPEICDNIDNNCDGQIDEGLFGCCKPTGVEVCDSVDNDCNGQVDDLDENAVVFCYEGNPRSSVVNKPCRPGVNVCKFGRIACYDQVLPEAEICDGVDNDCDGQTDEDLSSTKPVDIVFVMDNSGSMGTAAQAVMASVVNFATVYNSDTSIRWALVAAPPEVPPGPDNQWFPVIGPTVVTDFTTAANFSVEFSKQNARWGGGDEPTLDAMYYICHNDFGLNWTPDSKRVLVMLTDEMPQSYATPLTTIANVVSACRGYTVLLFVESTNFNWKTIAIQLNAPLKDIRASNLSAELSQLVTNSLCRAPSP